MKRHFCLLFFLSLVIAAATTSAQTAAEMLERAGQGLSAGRPDDAINDASEAIKLDAKNAEAYRLRGQGYALKLQQEPAPTNWTVKPVPVDQRSPNAAKALADLDMAIGLNAADPYAYYFRAAVYYLLKELRPSAADLERAVAAKPDYKAAATLLADVKKRLASTYAYEGSTLSSGADKLTDEAAKIKQVEEAVRLFTLALETNPSDDATYSSRAYAYEKLGKYDLAARDLGAVIGLIPKDTLTFYRRGLIYVKQKEYEKALADFAAPIVWLEKDPKSGPSSAVADLRTEMGKVYILKGDATRALAELDTAVKLSPRSHLIYYERGRAYVLKGDPAAAEADFRKAIEIVPGHVGSVTELRKLGKAP